MKKSNWSTVSRHERGYGTAWTKLRVRVLERDGYLCQCNQCKRDNRTSLATEVHHIKPKAKGGTDSLENLMSINSDCHKRETAAEQGRTLLPKVTIGADGYPVRWAS